MTLGEDMKRRRKAIRGCDTILFGDLRTATVLFAAAGPGLHQEYHDALLARARICLLDVAPNFAANFFDDASCATSAISVSASRIQYFKRCPAETNEVYCASANSPEALEDMKVALDALIDRNVA